MFKHLIEIVKNLKGEVLAIGVDDKILAGFKSNDSVNVFTLNKVESLFERRKKKIKRDKTGKDINIKRLRKYFKKQKFDYMIINYEEIEDYLKYVVRDIVYLNTNTLYLYCDMECDIELLIKRFNRYGASIKVTKYKESILLEIDNKKSKTNWLKNKLYYVPDTLYNIGDIISNILVN